MKKTLKAISIILAVATALGVISVANPVLAADVNEDYLVKQTLSELETINGNLFAEELSYSINEKSDYHGKSVKRAGEVYINDFSGKVHIEREDVSLYCAHLPVNITSYFTSGATELVAGQAYGWRTSYNQTVEYVNTADGGRILYFDDNGRAVYFKNSNTIINNKELWEEDKISNNNEYGYELYLNRNTDQTINLSSVTIECEEKMVRSFNSYGEIIRISKNLKLNENSNSEKTYFVSIQYVTYGNQRVISKVIDEIGREYRFNYSLDQASSKYLVNQIQVFDKNGSAITVSGLPLKISFLYGTCLVNGTTQPTLTRVVYQDNKYAEYALNESTQLVKGINGYAVYVEKVNSTTQRISERAYSSSTSFTTGGVLTITKVNDYERIFTDANNITKTKQFDFYGKTINTKNNNGTTIIPVINSDISKTFGKIETNLYNVDYYENIYDSENLVVNSSFTNGTSGWNINSGTIDYQHSYSLRFSSTSSYATQTVAVEDGEVNDIFILEFSSKQVGNTGETFDKILVESREAGSSTWTTVKALEVNPLNSNWQTYAYRFKVPENYRELKITLSRFQNGTTYFDDINLYKDTKSVLDYTLDNIDISKELINEYANEIKIPFELSGTSLEYSLNIDDTEWSNQIVTDFNGNSQQNFYDEITGLLESSVNGENGETLYNYNGAMALESVTEFIEGLSNGNAMTSSYTYENDEIKSITHNGFSYNYTYDAWGNVSSVKVNNQNIVSYQYATNTERSTPNRITFGNGDYWVYTYTNNLINSIKLYNGSNNELVSSFSYSYVDGLLSKITDNILNIETIYNENTTTVKLLNGSGTADDVVYNTYTRNDDGSTIENFGGMCYNTSGIESDFDFESEYIEELQIVTAGSKEIGFLAETDLFGRPISKKAVSVCANNEGVDIAANFEEIYNYKDISSSKTTFLVDSFISKIYLTAEIDGSLESEEMSTIEYFYEYDNLGNITRIYLKDIDDDGNVVDEYTLCSYVYDTAGQLVRENNVATEKTYTYTYDIGGNIVSKTEYEFTEVTNLSGVATTDIINYSYDNTWKDKLVNYNGTTIAYDEIGNPLNFVSTSNAGEAITGALEWSGSQLKSALVDSERYVYSYDSEGLRVKTEIFRETVDQNGNAISTYNGELKYLWRDGKLAGYSSVNSNGETEQTIKMLFDVKGDSIGYTYYDEQNQTQETFFFGKNLQGDISVVYNEYGEPLVSYVYDAWGNVTAQAHGSSLESILSALVALAYTPITYRGYNYDLTTGLYYLQSRYYNPTYGRFLNADTTRILEKTIGETHGANLFAYCNNNPIMNVDYTGESPFGFGLLYTALLFLVLAIVLGLSPDDIKAIIASKNAREDDVNNMKDYNYG